MKRNKNAAAENVHGLLHTFVLFEVMVSRTFPEPVCKRAAKSVYVFHTYNFPISLDAKLSWCVRSSPTSPPPPQAKRTEFVFNALGNFIYIISLSPLSHTPFRVSFSRFSLALLDRQYRITLEYFRQ